MHVWQKWVFLAHSWLHWQKFPGGTAFGLFFLGKGGGGRLKTGLEFRAYRHTFVLYMIWRGCTEEATMALSDSLSKQFYVEQCLYKAIILAFESITLMRPGLTPTLRHRS